MANFYIKTEQVENIAAQFMTLNGRLTTLAGDLFSVRRNLGMAITIKGRIGYSLEKAFAHSMVQANCLKQLSLKLQEAASLYKKTENALIGQAAEQHAESIKDAMPASQELLDFINDPRSTGLFLNYADYMDYIQNLSWFELLILGINEKWDVLGDLLYGRNNAVENMKDTLAGIIKNMEQGYADPAMVDEIKKYIEGVGKLTRDGFDVFNEFTKAFDIDLGALDLIEGGSEILANAIADYSKSIEILDALKSMGIENEAFSAAVDQLFQEYHNNFEARLLETVELLADTAITGGVDAVANLATGGAWGLVNFVEDTVMGITGLSAQADAIMDMASATAFEMEIQDNYKQAIETIRSGDYTEADIKVVETMFELQKATKIRQYENYKQILREKYLTTFSFEDMKEYDRMISAVDQKIAEIKSLEMNVNSL